MAVPDRIYELLTNEEDARLCEDIDEAACREAPRSFVLLLSSHCLTKLGDALASPKTTLAWLATVLGAPAYVLGFLVPIRESGSLIPQLLIGGMIRRLPVRKWVWVGGSLAQCACVAGIGVTAMSLRGRAAGAAMLGLIAVFSLARGFCSVASKDVLGKTVPKRKRGQLTGWSASAAGLAGLAAGLALMSPVWSRLEASVLGAALIGAGALWLLAAGVFAAVPEQRGETGGAGGVAASFGRLRLIVSDAPFRRFLGTRALLMCSALSAPFYVALAQRHFGSPAYLLGAFIAASGAAGLVSAPFWGRFADVSSRAVMVTAAAATSAVGIATFAVDRWMPALAGSAWFLPAAYFVLSVAHGGVRIGRKTYVVDLASGNRRTDYVAVGNSAIGVLLPVVGAIGALAPTISNAGVIGLLALMGLAGAVLGTTLPDA